MVQLLVTVVEEPPLFDDEPTDDLLSGSIEIGEGNAFFNAISMGTDLYISWLGASPQGKGYGSVLLELVKGWAADNGYLSVSLIPADDRLYAYYKRMGFTAVEEVDDEDQPLMRFYLQ